MYQINKNKELILEYFNALSGVIKTPEVLNRFVEDEELRNHILFIDAVFPGYAIIADEMTAEGNRVAVRAHVKGQHEGEFKGIPPTHRQVEFGVAICYTIENNKIVNHWMIVDLAALMEQLSVTELETA